MSLEHVETNDVKSDSENEDIVIPSAIFPDSDYIDHVMRTTNHTIGRSIDNNFHEDKKVCEYPNNVRDLSLLVR